MIKYRKHQRYVSQIVFMYVNYASQRIVKKYSYFSMNQTVSTGSPGYGNSLCVMIMITCRRLQLQLASPMWSTHPPDDDDDDSAVPGPSFAGHRKIQLNLATSKLPNFWNDSRFSFGVLMSTLSSSSRNNYPGCVDGGFDTWITYFRPRALDEPVEFMWLVLTLSNDAPNPDKSGHHVHSDYFAAVQNVFTMCVSVWVLTASDMRI